jgi:hypothetical protein
MMRDREGNAVITNLSVSAAASMTRAAMLGDEGPLRGGFGSTD